MLCMNQTQLQGSSDGVLLPQRAARKEDGFLAEMSLVDFAV